MEDLCKRFPHLSERILSQVDDRSLNKIKLISGDMLEYLDKERFFWIRLIKKYQNPHYCRYGYHLFKLFGGFKNVDWQHTCGESQVNGTSCSLIFKLKQSCLKLLSLCHVVVWTLKIQIR